MKKLLWIPSMIAWFYLGWLGARMEQANIMRQFPNLYNGRYEKVCAEGACNTVAQECISDEPFTIALTVLGPVSLAGAEIINPHHDLANGCPDYKITPKVEAWKVGDSL
jgi:hypothetical protein